VKKLKLTKVQHQVAELAVQDLSSIKIAEILGWKYNTVVDSMHLIRLKLGYESYCANRVDVIKTLKIAMKNFEIVKPRGQWE
jgi:hypothetical protein